MFPAFRHFQEALSNAEAKHGESGLTNCKQTRMRDYTLNSIDHYQHFI